MTARLVTSPRVRGKASVGTRISPHLATSSSCSPCRLKMSASVASHRRAALWTTASSTGCRSLGELLMTRKISEVAVCCSCASVWSFRASARRFSRSRTLESSFFRDLRGTAGLAWPFVGFGPRPISLSLASEPESAGDRLGDRARLGNYLDEASGTGSRRTGNRSSQLPHLRHRLLQPEPHVHLAVHRCRGGQVLQGRSVDIVSKVINRNR